MFRKLQKILLKIIRLARFESASLDFNLAKTVPHLNTFFKPSNKHLDMGR